MLTIRRLWRGKSPTNRVLYRRQHLPAFEKWMHDVTALFKSLDSKHLLSTGNEGSRGCEGKIDVYELLHAEPGIDYCTIHIWPKNWRWLDVKDMPGSIDDCIKKTNEYIDQHCAVARKLGKPIVLEEYGFPRDGHAYTLDSCDHLPRQVLR